MRVGSRSVPALELTHSKERVESSKVGRSGTVRGGQTWTDPKSGLVRQFGTKLTQNLE